MVSNHEGLTAIMAKSKVTATLILLTVMMVALIVSQKIKQELVPRSATSITVSVSYHGADPEVIESSIILPIEAQLQNIDGVKSISSSAYEHVGKVELQLSLNADETKVLNEIRNKVTTVDFPDDAKQPIFYKDAYNGWLMSLALGGPYELHDLYKMANRIRRGLESMDGVSSVDILYKGVPQISVEVPRDNLEMYGITLEQISDAIELYSQEKVSGVIDSERGIVSVHTGQRISSHKDYKNIPIVSFPDGSFITLGSIATIREFIYNPYHSEYFFNGENAVRMSVRVPSNANIKAVSDEIKQYVDNIGNTLPIPDNLSLVVEHDASIFFNERLSLLTKNALQGVVLVFLVLALFLEIRLAFWVTIGIPFSICGSLIFFYLFGLSINFITTFAFILTLGVVVDDAIVVGESIYEKRKKGLSNQKAAILGVQEVQSPVVFSVLTNIVPFLPLCMIPSFNNIPAVVTPVFLLSLFDTLFLIPAHLSREASEAKIWYILNYPQRCFSKYFKHFAENQFAPALEKSLKHKYILMFIAILGLYVSYKAMPEREVADLEKEPYAYMWVKMSSSASLEKRRKIEKYVMDAANDVIKSYQRENIVRGISIYHTGGSTTNTMDVVVLMGDNDNGEMEDSVEFTRRWKEKLGDVPDVISFYISGAKGWESEGIDIYLSHSDPSILSKSIHLLKEELSNYEEVHYVQDDSDTIKKRYNILPIPGMVPDKFVADHFEKQISGFLNSSDSIKIYENDMEWEVAVRLPPDQANKIATLDNMMLQIPEGEAVSLIQNVDIKESKAKSDIYRFNGIPSKSVTVKLKGGSSIPEIMDRFSRELFPNMKKNCADLKIDFSGRASESNEAQENLAFGFYLALIMIYILLAINFQNYSQPILIMTAIPFGLCGAIYGHILFGESISNVSMCGFVVLAGIVVNDSLLLISTANRYVKEKNMIMHEAVNKAAKRRLRPILLTSITTCAGLIPTMFDTSIHTEVMRPLAIAISFGLMLSTIVTLLLVPAMYLILEDSYRYGGKSIKWISNLYQKLLDKRKTEV